ncbi:MAG TPA: hypothetical protein PKG54_13390 [Phycisphaerae bacterium]|jgi:hypothetical protein|nr:hypothetical protein [Phycisphaerae bacterium]HOB75506.1 hypothetical protein [Phycisphaerae bacterium]HOJ56726.1 hypothetical protein [Phycisphaerae bacterium]HOL27168.1 hypothetical protein [Phycisphaerae bacterium]HPP21575.1 hypothetical protein [Phycisphaerae bacterium]
MNQWQQSFAKRVDVLRESAIKKFETFADEVLDRTYEEYAAFTAQHDFRNIAPPHQRGTRFYKFALSEDAYVLLYFRARGIDAVESEYECSVPGHGCTEGEKVTVVLAEANPAWVERRFQTALDDLINHVSQACPAEKEAELAGV